MYVCKRECMYVYICVYEYVCVSVCVCIYVCVCVMSVYAEARAVWFLRCYHT